MLKFKDTLLSFLRIDDISKAVLFCFNDAPFANFKWGGSHVGVLVFLKWNDRRYMLLACPENWNVLSKAPWQLKLWYYRIEVVHMIRCLLLEILKLNKKKLRFCLLNVSLVANHYMVHFTLGKPQLNKDWKSIYVPYIAGLYPSTFADLCFWWRIEFYGYRP